MGPVITYYIVNGIKLDFPALDNLKTKIELPKIQSFKALKEFMELNTNEDSVCEFIFDTDKNHILLNIK